MRLYLASSWRNPYQPNAVDTLRSAGHEVYDFRHPPGGDHLGFSWADVDPDWRQWSVAEYVEALEHPIAIAGFASDFGAMQWADGCVLLPPCGRSAHLEAGWFVGASKPLWIVLDEAEMPSPNGSNPELMYRMAGVAHLVPDLSELVEALAAWTPPELDVPSCRVCGCTDEEACEGGCWWVPDAHYGGDLCSRCAKEAAA